MSKHDTKLFLQWKMLESRQYCFTINNSLFRHISARLERIFKWENCQLCAHGSVWRKHYRDGFGIQLQLTQHQHKSNDQTSKTSQNKRNTHYQRSPCPILTLPPMVMVSVNASTATFIPCIPSPGPRPTAHGPRPTAHGREKRTKNSHVSYKESSR